MFDIDQFLANPSGKALWDINKECLIGIARRLGLGGYSSLNKGPLREMVFNHLVEEGMIREDDIPATEESDKEPNNVDPQIGSDNELSYMASQIDNINEPNKIAPNGAIANKPSNEAPQIVTAKEPSNLALQVELRKIELQLEILRREQTRADAPVFRLESQLASVPKFNEDEPDRFFAIFEKMAHLNGWPLDKWTQLVYRSFTGKALDVFSALSEEQVKDYYMVKSTVLTSYQLVPEAYRQQFRNLKKGGKETYVEYFRRKQALFQRWIESESAHRSHDKLAELILLEDIRNNLHPDVRAYLDQRGIRTLADAGPVADHYILTNPRQSYRSSAPASQPSQVRAHQAFTLAPFAPPPTSAPQAAAPGPWSPSGFPSYTTGKPVARETGGPIFNSERKPFCKYCRRLGHDVNDCFRVKNKIPSHPGSPSLSINVAKQTEVQLDPLSPTNNRPVVSPTSSTFEPYCSSGSVALNESSVPVPIKILRDTGSALSLITKEAVPFLDECYTGNWVLVNGLTGGSRIPLCQLYLQSHIKSGYVTLGVVDRVPVDGVSLLIGNDLAGGVTLPNVMVSSRPTAENNTTQLEKDIPGLFPACAVTRSMSQQADVPSNESVEGGGIDVVSPLSSEKSEEDPIQVDPPDLGLGELFKDSSPTDKPNNTDENSVTTLTSFGSSPVTRSKLVQLQAEDPELASFLNRAVSEVEAQQEANCYYTSSGVLMRKYRPATSPASHPWSVHHQIVIPKPLRQDILSIAHDGVGGHLGTSKTYAKILSHFYWPKLRRDVGTYCRTCRPCQLVGKPSPSIKPFPLQPIPVIKEPFSRITIDCVGPLPKTPRGHQFLLTIIDSATRYPEAIPLRRITAKNVVRALVHFFTQVGLPTVIQSDQGSNFTSRLFNQVMESLGVKQSRSSAYHPQSQGVVERFHQTLKRILRTFCLETGRDWDEGVDLLLFAIRDSVQESLGYSPFQLVYGHEARGPLKVLKESWISNEPVTPLASYVTKFKDKLQLAINLAHSNLEGAQIKMKHQFDKSKGARDRYFKSGDNVLAFLPLKTNPLQAVYSGPYQVLERQGQANYVLHTPERRKKKRLVHINLLKPYHDRGEGVVGDSAEADPPSPACLVVPEVSEESDESFSEALSGSCVKMENSVILRDPTVKLEHLSGAQAKDIESLLRTYVCIFGDHPRPCSALEHDVETHGAPPIRQRPYRLNTFKREYVRAEVQRLQELGIVQPSHSPWASPVVLVPKPDGSMRLCVDYRRVNAVTEADGYPLPRIDDVIDDVGSARWVTKLDLLKGYYQVRLTERSRAISAFVTPEGLYEFSVLPFGLRNAPATFQRLMNRLTAGMDGVRCYLDDIVVFGDTWELHLSRLKSLFAVLAANNLTVNLAKSEFGHARVTFLGHVVGQNEVRPVAAKIAAIQQYPTPDDKKAVMRLIGMAGYYRRFCPNFSSIVAPMTDLLSGKKAFRWSQMCQESFESLKTLLFNAPVLRAPNLEKPFTLHVDASDVAGGAVLLQEGEGDSVLHPVGYFSKKFNKHQRNYATVEKEALALLLALDHFRIYIGSTIHPVQVRTDHNPLIFVEKMKNTNQTFKMGVGTTALSLENLTYTWERKRHSRRAITWSSSPRRCSLG
ncbi:uncharacterized protein LOC143037281 [Oratosquilla oratoria]|uniref:uncharacterized protein LOC143037281 n=1 Tax=Oratosquilla oratoria TaxID=337810 RepID=UPI003F769E99